MYFVYILKCKDGSLYTGITTDVKRRLQQHKDGKGGAYTRAHTPIKIVYTESRRTRGAALKREIAIKSLPKSEKMSLIARAR